MQAASVNYNTNTYRCLRNVIYQVVSLVLRKDVGGSDSEDCMTLRMTAAEAVETSVTTTNSLSQTYTNLDDHISETSINTPRFKPFTFFSPQTASWKKFPKTWKHSLVIFPTSTLKDWVHRRESLKSVFARIHIYIHSPSDSFKRTF